MKETAFARYLRNKYNLELGGFSDKPRAPNGQPHIVLTGAGDEDAAEEAFAAYMKAEEAFASHVKTVGNCRTLWWRVVPEISPRGYYMRLSIV